MEYDNTNSGALFRNDRKQNENQPDHTGSINVEGVDYWLSAWIKTSKDGKKKFFSLAVKPKDEGGFKSGQQAPSRSQQGVEPMHDDIPFAPRHWMS